MAFPLAYNLVGAWKLENNSRDFVGSNHMTDSGAITYGAGKLGNCASNAGTGVIGILSPSTAVRFTNNFTIAFWFKAANTTQANTYIISKQNAPGTDNDYSAIYEYVNDTIEFYAGGYTGTNPRTGSGITVSDTNWHHIAYSYNGTTWAGYKDGVQIFSVARTFSLAQSAGALRFFTFNGITNKVNGFLDEILFFNTGLTQAQITEVYNGIGYPFREMGNFN